MDYLLNLPCCLSLLLRALCSPQSDKQTQLLSITVIKLFNYRGFNMVQMRGLLYLVSLDKYSFINTFFFSFQIIKYGVISTDSLTEDLMHWKTMYVAGRLHKPVSIMIWNENCFN